MMRNLIVVFLAVNLLLGLTYSCKDDDSDSIPKETLAANAWIRENMELYYLWNNRLPNIDDTKQLDSEAYFYDLLYDAEDKWSWITDD